MYAARVVIGGQWWWLCDAGEGAGAEWFVLGSPGADVPDMACVSADSEELMGWAVEAGLGDEVELHRYQ